MLLFAVESALLYGTKEALDGVCVAQVQVIVCVTGPAYRSFVPRTSAVDLLDLIRD